MLRVPRRLRPYPRLRVIGAHQMQQVCRLQTRRSISKPLFVDEKREGDPSVLAEKSGVGTVAEANSRQCRMFFRKSVFVFAQLRDVFAAEKSAVMAKEHDDGRLPLP